MGFKWINAGLYAVPSRITHIPGTASETYTKGEALTISSGGWTKASAAGTVGGFANESKTCSSTDLTLEVIEARVGDRFRVPYTGTPDSGFIVGVKAADLASDGLSINSADVTGGSFAVWEKIVSKTECVVTVVSRIFS